MRVGGYHSGPVSAIEQRFLQGYMALRKTDRVVNYYITESQDLLDTKLPEMKRDARTIPASGPLHRKVVVVKEGQGGSLVFYACCWYYTE